MNSKETEEIFIDAVTKANIERMYQDLAQKNISMKDPVWVVILGLVAVVNKAQNDMTEHTEDLKEQMTGAFETHLAKILNEYKNNLVDAKDQKAIAETRLNAAQKTIESLNEKIQQIVLHTNNQAQNEANTNKKNKQLEKKINILIGTVILLGIITLIK